MVTHRDGLPVAGYDANGNPSAGSGQVMTQRVEGDVTYQQGWDADNRLVALTDTVSGATVQFAYDADGNRVKRTDAAGTTYYAGSGTFELWVPATTTLNSTVAVVSPLNQFPWRSYPVETLARTYYFVGGQRVVLSMQHKPCSQRGY